MWTTSGTSRGFRIAVAALLGALAAAPCSAQAVYRYRDADGGWVFSDREPQHGAPFEVLDVEHDEQAGMLRLYERRDYSGASVLAAENTFFGPVQIAFRVVGGRQPNVTVPARGNRILAPRSDTVLFEIGAAAGSRPSELAFEYQLIHGSPRARHRPARPYRLPYAKASRFRVSQASPDTVTHRDAANADAIDFEMPVGTHVFAARGGVVIEVASDFFESGLERRFVSRANMIRILHTDGTMGLYAHLSWNSIRVAPGQHVRRGEYIADSGNTGFSSGPHLHFVVQKNIGGAIGSVPVEFSGPRGEPIRLKTGDRPIAR